MRVNALLFIYLLFINSNLLLFDVLFCCIIITYKLLIIQIKRLHLCLSSAICYDPSKTPFPIPN
jgi:hypothetical protein